MTLFTLERKEDKLLITKLSEIMSYADLEDFIEETTDLELYQTADDKIEIVSDKEDLDLFIEQVKAHAVEESISCTIKDTLLIFEDKAMEV